MSTITRRDFFRAKLGRGFRETVLNKQDEAENGEVLIGKIADFPVGEKKLLEKHQLIVESYNEGLRVSSFYKNENKFYSIKVNKSGELIVNRSESWPPGLVFSILTYEPAEFDLSQEEKHE